MSRNLTKALAHAALLVACALGVSACASAAAQDGGFRSAGKGKGGQRRARLTRGGRAIPPDDAPKAVREAIAAANRIRNAPYASGGGHGSFESSGYDCSGAVSYALHGGGLLRTPMASAPLAAYGKPGKGEWIDVYANGGHAYVVIAGLRFDTAGTGSSGPSWHRSAASEQPGPYTVRHPAGL
jgi:hypothetical protein